MPLQLDLKELEQKLRKSIHLDGLLEITLGFILLVSTLSSTLSELGVSDALRISIYVPLMLSASLIVFFGKKYITNPRLGLVKFGPSEKKHDLLMVAIAVVSAVLLFAGLVWIALMPLLITLFLMAIFSFLAYFLDYPRLYVVGFLFALTEPLYVLFRDHTDITHVGAIAYGIPGAIVIAVGLLSLRGFLLEYPLPPGEVSDGTS